LGIDINYLAKELEKLEIGNFSIDVKKIMLNGITASQFKVIVDQEKKYHRNYYNIAEIIDKSALNLKIKETSKKIFYRLAEAESKVHNQPIDKVHFHEIGAIDSIVDIVGSTICIEYFNIERIFSSPLKLGTGFIKSSHGVIPIPAPATVELVKHYPVIKTNIQTELTTPTGAAVLTTISEGVSDALNFIIQKCGYGAGSKEIEEIPNLTRIIIGKTEQRFQYDEILVIESNIDDINPEIYPFVIEKLIKNDALDVYITPIIMKRGRPGNTISVLCEKMNLHKIAEIIFNETTTIGLRISEIKRLKLKREIVEIDTPFGKVKAKKVYLDGKEKIVPEYKECISIAEKNNISLAEVYNIIIKSSF
jgi:uncharacterized protein (TIGR00299 family) protein